MSDKQRKRICIGLLAHVDSGKTTLSEAMLYLSGALRSFGRVDKGASFLDNNDMERQRGITIYSKQARFSYENTDFVLIDTPGHADFSAEMERSLQVLDYAVLLISASDGIRGQTQILWRILRDYRIPTFLFFNKMDQEGSQRQLLLKTVQEELASEAVDFTDTADAAFFDQIAMCSEEAMNSFLEKEMVPEDMIREMVVNRKLFPCYFGSALRMEGVEEFLQGLDHYTLRKDYPEEFGARVYKILRDTDGSRLTFMKITGGTLKNKSFLPDGDGQAKINQIRVFNGSRYTLTDEAEAGEICAVTGLKESFAGQGFGRENASVMPVLMPVLSYRVLLPENTDALKVLPDFRILEEETPELTVSWDEEHQDIYVCVMGEVQLEILKTVLQERFHLDTGFDNGEVMYRETISKAVIGAGHFEPLRHYAEVQFLMEPLPRGRGLEFDTDVSTDLLAKNWQRLILTHLREKQHRGVLTGSPITDMRIVLIAGRAHLKHTEGGDFRQAVYRAVRQGLMMTDNLLLEPYYSFLLEVPTAALGRALNDLDRMGAQFSQTGSDTKKGMSVISGKGPVSVLKAYPRELAAYTQGQGAITMVSDGYDICHNAAEVIAGKEYDPTTDVRNTPDSVFCAHGSGYIVPYHQVYNYIDVPLGGIEAGGGDLSETALRKERQTDQINIGQDEINEIISRISMSNSRDKKKGKTWKRKFGSDEYKALPASEVTARSKMPEVFSIDLADHVIVDGYNVIFAWQELSDLARENIDSARDALIDILSNLQSMITGEVTVVFDAYKVKEHRSERMKLQDVQIVYTGEEETADQYIEKFTNSKRRTAKIAVVTSDRLEQIITRGQGCMLLSSRDLRKYIDDLSSKIRERFDIR